jgi:hypothetical protein
MLYVIFLGISRIIQEVRFQVLTAASMMFRAIFWVLLPCRMIVDNQSTRQYNPEDNSEQQFRKCFQTGHGLLPNVDQAVGTKSRKQFILS